MAFRTRDGGVGRALEQWFAKQRCPSPRGFQLPLDADDKVQVDVLIGDEPVLEVAGKTRVGGGVIALRDRSAEKCLGVG